MLEMIDFSIRNTTPEKIGYKGENLAETLEILTDSGSEWSYTLEARMGCNAYSVAVMDYADGKITLPLTSNILRMEGTHEAQIVAIKGEVVKKSNIFFIRVGDAISAGQNLPGVEESIFNQQVSTLTALVQSANDAKQEIADNAERVEQAAQRAEDGKTVAVDAAKRAEDSEVIASAEALSARASAIRAETFAQKAEEIVEGFGPEGGGSGGYNPPEGGIPLTDLSEEVQAALQKAETALQSFEEADPTVPEWARVESKPTYTAAEVGALPSDTPLFSGDYNDLENKPTIPEAVTDEQVQEAVAAYCEAHQVEGTVDAVARAELQKKQDRVLSTGGWESPLEEHGKTRFFINPTNNKLNNTTVNVSVLYEVEPGTTYRIIKGESSRFRVGECSDNIASSAPGNFLGDFDGQNEAIVTTTDFKFLIIQVTTSSEKLFPEMSVQKYGEGGYEQGGIYAFEAGADELKRIDTMFQPAGAFRPYFTAADDVDCVMDYTGVIALYDALMEAHPDYMSKRTISTSFESDGDIPIVEYRMTTGNWNARTGNRAADGEMQKPVILLSSGTHGGEKAAVMGLYCCIKALVSGEFCLRGIREKYEFRVVPVVCPYSYNRGVQWNGESVLSVRTNRNGVNINRNFPVDWRYSNTYPHNFSGNTAGSEYETKTMMAWFTEFSGAVYVDVHNSGYYSEISYFAPNHNVPADAKAALKVGFRDGVSKILPRLRDERGLDGSNVILAYTGETSTGGSTTAGASSCGCKAALLELSEKVPGESVMTTPVSIGVNAEIVANALKGICEVAE